MFVRFVFSYAMTGLNLILRLDDLSHVFKPRVIPRSFHVPNLSLEMDIGAIVEQSSQTSNLV